MPHIMDSMMRSLCQLTSLHTLDISDSRSLSTRSFSRIEALRSLKHLTMQCSWKIDDEACRSIQVRSPPRSMPCSMLAQQREPLLLSYIYSDPESTSDWP